MTTTAILTHDASATAIYKRYAPEVAAICKDIVGDDDGGNAAATEAWVVIVTLMGTLDHPDSAKPWIRLTAIQAANRYVADNPKRHLPKKVVRKLATRSALPLDTIERIALKEALGKIPHECAEVFQLRLIRLHKPPQIMRMLGIDAETYQERFGLALQLLKEILTCEKPDQLSDRTRRVMRQSLVSTAA